MSRPEKELETILSSPGSPARLGGRPEELDSAFLLHTPSPAGSPSPGVTPYTSSATGSPVLGGSFAALPQGFSGRDALETVAGTVWTPGGGAAPSGPFEGDLWVQAAILEAFIGTPMESRIPAAFSSLPDFTTGSPVSVPLSGRELALRGREKTPKKTPLIPRDETVEREKLEREMFITMLDLLKELPNSFPLGSLVQECKALISGELKALGDLGKARVVKEREERALEQENAQAAAAEIRSKKRGGTPLAVVCKSICGGGWEFDLSSEFSRFSKMREDAVTFVDRHLDPREVAVLCSHLESIIKQPASEQVATEFLRSIGSRMVESVMLPHTAELLNSLLEKRNFRLLYIFRGVRPLKKSGDPHPDSEIDAIFLFQQEDGALRRYVPFVVSVKTSATEGSPKHDTELVAKFMIDGVEDVIVNMSGESASVSDEERRNRIGAAEYRVTSTMLPIINLLRGVSHSDPATVPGEPTTVGWFRAVLGERGAPKLEDIIKSLSKYEELRQAMVKLVERVPSLLPGGIGSLPVASRSVNAEMAVYGPIACRVSGTPQMQMAHFLIGVKRLISQLKLTGEHPHLLAMLEDKLRFTLSFDHLLKLESEQIEAETRKIEEAMAKLEKTIHEGASKQGRGELCLFSFRADAGGASEEAPLAALHARRKQLEELCASAALVTPLPLSAHSPGADVPSALPRAPGGSVVTSHIASLRARLSTIPTIPTTGAAGAPPRSPSPVDHDVASADDGSVRLSVDQFLSADRLFALDFGRPAGKPVKVRLFDLSTGGGALADTPAVAAASAVDWGAPPPPFLHLCTLSVGGGLDEREESYAAPTAVAELPVLPDGAAGGAFAALAECARREKGELALQEELYPPVAPPPPSSPRSPSPS